MENTEIQTANNESFDFVSDKIIAKKKQKKIIISSVILALVLIVSALVITFANINYDLKPKFLSNADAYDVYLSGNVVSYDKGDESYDEFMKEYNEIFDISCLSALFSGKIGRYSVDETNFEFYNSYKSGEVVGTGISSNLKNSLGSKYIHLIFNTEQKMLTKEGKQYYTSNHSSRHPLYFQDCYLRLDSTETDSMTFFVGTYYTSKATITKINVKASSFELYEYLNQ